MRVKGLVRAANTVRSQLQAGLRPDEVHQFRKQVESLVYEVEEICKQGSLTPDHLPGPSRRAYRFLKELDLNNLPARDTDKSVERTPGFRIKGVVKTGESFAAMLWRESALASTSSDAQSQLQRDIQERVSEIERTCSRHNAAPSVLETPSKQVYRWLKLLSSKDNLSLHRAALGRAGAALSGYPAHIDRPVHLHMINMSSLWRTRRYSDMMLLKVSEGFLHADQQVWQAIIHSSMGRRDQAMNRLVHEFAESDDFSEVVFEMESLTESVHHAQGRVYNLDDSFDRVNAAHFDGRMIKPTLAWNRTITARTFGYFQAGRDAVTLSVSLDDPQVPASLLDFVMYHELLHKKHGVTMVNGRRLVHTPGFHTDERRFPGYNSAKDQLDGLAMRHRA